MRGNGRTPAPSDAWTNDEPAPRDGDRAQADPQANLAKGPVSDGLQPHAMQQMEAERRRAAARVREQLGLMLAITNSLGEGVYTTDRDGRVTFANPACEHLLGWSEAELLSQDIHDLIHVHSGDGSGQPPEECPLTSAVRTGSSVRCDEDVFFCKDGSPLPVAYISSPVQIGGAVAGAVIAFRDITERKRIDRQREEFLSIVSHELKTPLTTLKILSQLTRRRLEKLGVLDATHAVRMDRSIGRMERLVNDLLDVTRIDSGKLALRLKRCDLVAICREAAQDQMAVAERTVRLKLPDSAVLIDADPERIEQVVTNLLSNALKYSPPDRPVTLAVRKRPHEAIITVADEGGGIPQEGLLHLFERFYRVPGVQVQSGSGVGLGLGLYISREIVERHGGRIWAESSVPHGSTFVVTLPLAPY